MVFIATNYADVKNPRNPDRALVRFQWLEAIVRLALAKFQKGGQTNNPPSENVDRLLVNHILPVASNFNLAEFRENSLWFEEIDMVFKKHWQLVCDLYRKYSGKLAKPGQKRFMSLEEWTQFITDYALTDETFTTREIPIAFNFAMMTVVDELNTDRMMEMAQVEFVEALARVADMKNIDPSDPHLLAPPSPAAGSTRNTVPSTPSKQPFFFPPVQESETPMTKRIKGSPLAIKLNVMLTNLGKTLTSQPSAPFLDLISPKAAPTTPTS
eukprot:GILI01018590.1.p2 GENE.GILI01018590.1~~GILI01018590.1.p2  ORF type:complete len:279 (+),score=105.14 GILI01018590.1:31-837(+)